MTIYCSPISTAKCSNFFQKIHQRFSISTQTLGTALYVTNTLAACFACSQNLSATLSGGIIGSAARNIAGDNQQTADISDKERRISRIALMCLTASATLYTIIQPTSSITPYVQGFIGYSGMANGIFPLLRKAMG